jgi:amino acid transporter
MPEMTPAVLRRRLTLPLLVLYGVGVTIGAGIYVLIGAMAGQAGIHAPLAFILAGLVMALTAASYADLVTRLPYSAGEATYVKVAFRSTLLSRLTGVLTIVVGIVSAAAVSVGSAGYIREFVDLPQWMIIVAVVAVLALVAIWGILESVVLAGLFTLIEVSGLVAIIAAGWGADLHIAAAMPRILTPPPDAQIWSGIAFASMLAFFAFIGFEDLANVVEEVREPEHALPRAIGWTLVISVVLYFLVAAIAVLAVPVERLSASAAPLSLVFREVAGMSPAAISAIAIVATLNTVLVQMTMASRVIYGMASQGDLPAMLGRVQSATATPLLATGLVALFVLLLAVSLPIEPLAEWTSVATLFVFALVNLALIRIRQKHGASRGFTAPRWVPVAGLLTCLLMLATTLL